VNVWSHADSSSDSKSERTSIRGNFHPSIGEKYANEVEGPPGTIDRREEWRSRIRDEKEKGKVRETNWVSAEFDGWKYREDNTRIRESQGSVIGVEYGAGPPTASH
jgi:hypothetical protein